MSHAVEVKQFIEIVSYRTNFSDDTHIVSWGSFTIQLRYGKKCNLFSRSGKNICFFAHMWQPLTFWEVQCWRLKTWGESDVVKFAHNVNWISAHWLKSFKASPVEYDAAFLMVTFTLFICTLSEFFHILDQWKEMPLARVMKVYPTCMLFIPINGNEDGKSS